jgi:DNA repair protein RadC
MPAPVMMTKNLFFGGEIPVPRKQKKDKGSYYWVTTRLFRESGPWYVTSGIKGPDDVYRMVNEYLDLENCDREHFIVICLNRKGNVTAAEVVSRL